MGLHRDLCLEFCCIQGIALAFFSHLVKIYNATRIIVDRDEVRHPHVTIDKPLLMNRVKHSGRTSTLLELDRYVISFKVLVCKDLESAVWSQCVQLQTRQSCSFPHKLTVWLNKCFLRVKQLVDCVVASMPKDSAPPIITMVECHVITVLLILERQGLYEWKACYNRGGIQQHTV